MGEGPITVAVNSPGGDFFTGVSVYNQLLQHDGDVTVKVMGLAGSAASVIAMAGDEILMGKTAQMFIHNSIGFTVGNKTVHASTARDLDDFDMIMAKLYRSRSDENKPGEGMSLSDVISYMDAETFFDGERAVELGLATGLYDAKAEEEDDAEEEDEVSAHKRVSTLMREAGLSRLDREALMRDFKGEVQRNVGPPVARNADPVNVKETFERLSRALKG